MTDDRLRLAEIATARLRLRLLRVEDAEDLHRLTDDPSILSVVHVLPQPFTIREALSMVRQGDGEREAFLGGRLVADGRLVLACGVHLDAEDAIEIGYWVGVAHQGIGLAHEAVGALLPVLRAAFPARRLVAECRPENLASSRLLAKLGFRTSGEPGRRPGRVRFIA